MSAETVVMALTKTVKDRGQRDRDHDALERLPEEHLERRRDRLELAVQLFEGARRSKAEYRMR